MHKTFIGAVGLEQNKGNTFPCFAFYTLYFFFPASILSSASFVCVHVCMRACVRPGLQMLDVSLPVMMHQHVDNFFKQVRLLWAKEAASNLVNGLFQLRQPVVVLFSVVSERDRGEKKIKIKYTHH